MSNRINGFVFNAIGDLVEQPENPSIETLRDTQAQLFKQQNAISASRLQPLINAIELGWNAQPSKDAAA